MPDTPFTNFLQSPSDRPSPTPGYWPLQTPVDGQPPTPITDAFSQLLLTDLEGNEIDEVTWVNNLVALRRHETREKLKFREAANLTWERYNNRYDFEGKEAWQSRKVPPKVYLAVERLASLIYGVLEKSREWFDIESYDEQSQIYYNLVKHLLLWFLDHDQTNFKKVFKLNLKSGLLWQNMYFLITWEDNGEIVLKADPLPEDKPTDPAPNPIGEALSVSFEKQLEDFDSEGRSVILPTNNTPRLRISSVNPDYVLVDHKGRNRYVMWDVHYSRGECRRQAQKSGWDMDAVEEALTKPVTATTTTDNVAPYQEAQDARKQDRVQDQRPYQEAKVTYFFGDFFDQTTGELLMENCTFVVLNDAKLVVAPQPNPFWDGSSPLIASPITEVPFAAYGKSPIVQNADMFDLYVDTLNLMIDYINSILLGMKEVDLDVIDDYEEDFRSGMFPGKIIKKRGGGNPGVTAVTNVPTTDLPPGLWNAWGVYQKEVQDNVMITDAIGGQARTRGRVTAMEFNRRAADAGDMIKFVFECLQDNCLVPIIRKSFHTILQYMPQTMWANWVETHKNKIMPEDPKLKQVFEQIFAKVKAWTPTERWKNLAGFFKSQCRVFSNLGDRQMEIEKATFFLQTASQVPGLAPFIKYKVLGRKIASAFEWDPEEIISAEALPLPAGASVFIDPSAETSEDPVQTRGLPQPGGFNVGAPQSISTSPPFAPGTGGAGQPP